MKIFLFWSKFPSPKTTDCTFQNTFCMNKQP